jgi:hypothetical protein
VRLGPVFNIKLTACVGVYDVNVYVQCTRFEAFIAVENCIACRRRPSSESDTYLLTYPVPKYLQSNSEIIL